MATIELEFLIPNHRVCLDDEKPLNSLFDKLSSLQDFLKKEYNKGGAPIRDVEIKIRDFALKAEDVIEIQLSSLLLVKDDGEYQHKARGELHQTLRKVAEDADELLNIINTVSNEVETALENIVWGGSSQCSPESEDKMVGRHLEFTRIRDELLKEIYPQRRVIPILGVPGVGKTTLCKNVYADEQVASYFSIQAWVTIPRKYNLQQLLCHLLQSMRPTVNKIDTGSTVFQLKEQLYKHLKCKRYLAVLDDICNTLVWDDIQQCFPDDSNGSCILLNTRFRDVAEYFSLVFYGLSFLTRKKSWNLFCARLSLEQNMAPKFEEIAKRLVRECQGLPLSIVTVADRLSKCNYTLKEWKKIQKEFESLGTLHRDAQHSSKLNDTYNQLPHHLKVCFLYFAVFPKGIEIQVERLIRLWIAEGFVMPLKGLPLEDIAYMYLQDLERRGLVRDDFSFRILKQKTCYIHNDMHSFCVRETQKEGLLCALNTRQCIGWSLEALANSCRWLSLRSHSLDYYVLFSSNIPRSLFFFHGDSEMFITYKHLRILDLSQSLILKRVPFPSGDLVFLRYLSVPQWFEGLDDVVSTNSNLQTLIVSGIDESKLGAPTLPFPSKIWELQHLRHLELGDMYMVDPPNMVNELLQTLCCVMPIHFRKQVYCGFPSIRKLKIMYKDVCVPGCSSRGNSIITVENIENLLWLETLTVIVPVGSITLLERLAFPANLTKLRLSGTNFPVKVLRVIGELGVLKVLKLENGFYGRVWEVAGGGFRKLEEFVLEAKNLEQWVADGIHFPKLEKLVLRRCYCLEEIPRGFVKIFCIWSIEVVRCRPCVVTSAKLIQEDRKVKRPRVPIDLYVNGKLQS